MVPIARLSPPSSSFAAFASRSLRSFAPTFGSGSPASFVAFQSRAPPVATNRGSGIHSLPLIASRAISNTPTTRLATMTWTPPDPTSVGAPAVRVPEDTHTHSKVAEYKPVHLHLDWSIDWDARIISGRVSHVIELIQPGITAVTFDASYLKIKSVQVEGKNVDYSLGTQRGTLGAPLQVAIPSSLNKKGDKVHIDIEYSTTEHCTALGWLTKEQTAGKTNPFLYSQCQAIHCRSLVPCIDSPSHKITYTATVHSPIPVLMSALKDDSKPSQAGTYHFKQPVGIPSYLIAIVGGDLEFRKLGNRTGIWAEPPNADAVQWEFEADAERFLEHAEKVISPYSWTRYDSVVLPPSFPYGGMENANLTTLTPSLVCGDRSLTDVLLHELCHSWSGNLTSCANWNHFWLNEGWTVYLERLLLQDVHGPKEGPAHRGFSYIIGSKALKDALEQFTNTPRFQRLIPVFKEGEDPDDAFSSIPYEKGSNFLLYLERTVGGLDNFLPYAKSYFHAFYNRSVTTEEWREHLFKFFEGNAQATAALHKVDWDAWFHGEGLELPVKMEYDTTLAEQAFSLASRWIQVIEGQVSLESARFKKEDIKGWNANQVVVFLERLHSGPKVPVAITQKLDEVYEFSKATNGEVLLRFFEVALEVQGGKYAQQAAAWVKGQGRMKFCRTVYRALNKVEPELAKKTFLGNKSFYHPIAAAQIEKDLALSGVAQGCQGDIVTIFGGTGTGKTKLAVELARAVSEGAVGFGRYRGAEVISCDSMQIYKGLDIITNKASVDEMQGVPHHLLGFVDPAGGGGSYDVTQFVQDTNRIVGELGARGNLPIVCGGTTYYLQHLLFPGRLISSANTRTGSGARREGGVPDLSTDQRYQRLDREERDLLAQVNVGNDAKVDLATRATADPGLGMRLWKLLDSIDPVMAARWHYRDSRKVANSLRVYKETGRIHSDWIAEQDVEEQNRIAQSNNAEACKGGVSGCRKLLFWLWCDAPVLRTRLDDRVDDMVARGLEEEVREMRQLAKSMLDDLVSASKPNYQSGIFQTIGYRQFAEYLDRLEALTRTESCKDKAQWFANAVHETKTATRQYAKSQLKWVQNKLVPEVRRAQQVALELGGAEVELYLLDASDVALWNEKVLNPALEVLTRFLNHEPLPPPQTVSNPQAAKHYLSSGRTANQALSLSNTLALADPLTATGARTAHGEAEGVRTIEANKLFTCDVCTFDPAHPVLVREVERESHRKGRHHRNNAKKRLGNEEKQKRIDDLIAKGASLRTMRQLRKDQNAPKDEEGGEKAQGDPSSGQCTDTKM